ncbi:cell division cycle protein 23 homolog [Rhopilema esculentum]|uniref:cell division cycle protein 23 homolog n=2 Tax=Rhopilema esculentum TaxID=499914 RepID=UPI0031D657CF
MAALSSVSLSDVSKDLLRSLKECNARGLIHSANWAIELVSSLPPLKTLPTFEEEATEEFKDDFYSYNLAKGYFDLKEFERASHVSRNCRSHKGYFLHLYSLYMSGEKKKRYQMVDVLEPSSKAVENEELRGLRAELQNNIDKLDGYCFYLYGVVLNGLSLYTEAIEMLLKAVEKEPVHWGAWKELASICKNRETLQNLKLPNHWMAEFFQAQAELEVQMTEEALRRYENICSAGFAKSTYVKQQMALAYYNLRDFVQATEHFKDLQTKDPYMLDHVDTYSNILYIQDSKAELSYLAHRVAEVDKYRYESCGVIGNYYSLRGQHEKAVLYFRQALKLNPQHVVAWTLLGHEYVELKNTSAAIESYRRATEASAKDYRAWYGLGQTYEILKMPYYSLYYYNEAYKLRPYDSRILIALGDTYHSLDKNEEAKKCYLKAFRIGDPEGQASMKVAKLYLQSGEEDNAFRLYSIVLDDTDQSAFHTSEDVAKGLVFAARYCLKTGKYSEAEAYGRRATEHIETREEARSLLYEIRQARLGNEASDVAAYPFTTPS